ncbi:MAG TPA: EF-Tu/IF-2/RF-3 family GTPase [Nitrososphaeraceae archaeon]|nr:EF-Tu/IF-2/RF-3 family GTPase [Nitrososphaeraceae archaeon]
MESLNIAVLGSNEFLHEFGKRGTTSDIVIYDRKLNDRIFTFIAPISFPDKIQTLPQVLNMTDFVVLNITQLDKYLAEQIIAINSLDIRNGFLLHSYDIDEEKLDQMIKGTTIENFKKIESLDILKNEINNLHSNLREGDLLMPIDHSFDVKGVGTVLLGGIKQGKIKVYDKLRILPLNKEVLIKSIQMHDDPVDESSSPSRVGLAVKGVIPREIERGDIICSGDNIKTADTEVLVINYSKNKYYKGDITDTQTYLLSVGLQIKPVKIAINKSKILLSLEKPICYYEKQKFLILKPDSKTTRIIAEGSFPSVNE